MTFDSLYFQIHAQAQAPAAAPAALGAPPPDDASSPPASRASPEPPPVGPTELQRDDHTPVSHYCQGSGLTRGREKQKEKEEHFYQNFQKNCFEILQGQKIIPTLFCMVLPLQTSNVFSVFRTGQPSLFFRPKSMIMLHHVLNNYIGCQFTQGLYLKFLPLCINASPIMLRLIFVILPFLTNATNPVFAQAMMIDS